MVHTIAYPLRNLVSGIFQPGRLRKMPFEGQRLKREMQPPKIRWGWALLPAIALVLAMGEFSPAVSTIVPLP
jgi:hypothetical protein